MSTTTTFFPTRIDFPTAHSGSVSLAEQPAALTQPTGSTTKKAADSFQGSSAPIGVKRSAQMAGGGVGPEWSGVMKWKATVEQYARQFGVPVNLVLGMMKLESNGQNLPANVSGAVGPMQITAVWDHLGNRFDPVQNIRMACQILKALRDSHPAYGWDGAIRSYFSGSPYPSSSKVDAFGTSVDLYHQTVKKNWAYLDARLGASQGVAGPDPKAVRRGMQGDGVRRWQQALVQLGYLTVGEVATGPGIFGPLTEAATRKLQRDQGLPPTGIADKATRAAANKARAQLDAYNTTTLKRGMQGSHVLMWQRRLVRMGYLTESQLASGPGIFGPKTEAATRAFQRDYSLKVSGQVGPRTREVMEKALRGFKPAGGAPTPPSTTGGATFPVPYINQLTSDGPADDWNRYSNCGPATVAMIAKAFGFGRDMRDGTLVNFLGAKAGVGAAGVGWPGVQTMAQAAGLKSEHRSGNDLEWIRQQLRAGKLVAANGDRAVTLQNGGNAAKWGGATGGHWIVVVGVAANGDFLVMDPSTDCRRLSPSELKRYFNTRAGGGEMVSIGR